MAEETSLPKTDLNSEVTTLNDSGDQIDEVITSATGDGQTTAPNDAAGLDAQKIETATQEVANLQAATSGLDAQANSQFVIAAPTNGETVIHKITSLQNIKFGFDLDGVSVALSDVDLVLAFPDGSQIVLVGAGVDLLYESDLSFDFNGSITDKQQLVARIGSFEESDSQQIFQAKSNSGKTEEDPTEDTEVTSQSSAAAPAETEVVVEIVEVESADISSASQFDGENEAGKKSDAEDVRSRVEDDVAAEETIPVIASSGAPPEVEGDSFEVENENISPTEGDSDVDAQIINIALELFGVPGQTSSTLADGTTVITGSAAITAAETDSSFAIQQTAETVSGTSGDDIITADSQDLAPSGTTVRTLHVTADNTDTTTEITQIYVTGLPEGAVIINGTAFASGYLVPIDADNPSETEIMFQYQLPEEGATTDGNGFYSTFALNIEYTFENINSGEVSRAIGTARLAIRDVLTETDAEYMDPLTGETVYILNSTPPGNIIDSGAGDDYVIAGAGADQIDGSSGDDTVSYETSSSAVTSDLTNVATSGGYAEGDVLQNINNLVGSDYDDTLLGNSGDNTFEGGVGADTIDGIGGTNTAAYTGSDEGVSVDLATGIHAGGDAQGDTLTNIANVTGSDFADNLSGDGAANTLSGGAGNDILLGAGGGDVLIGGAGSDTADYTGSTAVNVDLLNNTASGGDAQGDSFNSIENIIGTAENDTLSGNLSDNVISGAAGDDTLSGVAGTNTLSGGAGNDSFIGGSGADTIDGGSGTDTVDYLASTSAVNVDLINQTAIGGDSEGDTFTNIEGVRGSNFDDVIIGDASDNVLEGNGGDDTFIGGQGADTFDGGADTDTVSYSTSAAGVQVNLDADTASGGDAGGDSLTAIENLTGSNFDDTLTGDASANVLSGGSGDDVLAGLGGADTLVGGDGTDSADYSASTSGVTVDLNLSTAQSGGDAAGDTLSGIENVVGSDENDTFYGDAGDNSFLAGAGDDYARGGEGADTLTGGSGTDTVDYSNIR